ncbi:hypothetical protein ADK90_28015 [Streptomyces sp. XY413]|uniref:hypothetical protein n=1 Tax=unclassified Streptomyces TaxID=2593676 RepID=UPI0006ADC16C|nr:MULTISPECIES: hypothetical protein [unclassified Streptomyces]KOU65105.1 hypothetical protein ADK96_18920 [Streptomyces sp. IGB124]KOV16370.1 hypothetical protein ADK90_28015 [Streptomyces sp. XY413]
MVLDEYEQGDRGRYREELRGLVVQFTEGKIGYGDGDLRRVAWQLWRRDLKHHFDEDEPKSRVYLVGFRGSTAGT